MDSATPAGEQGGQVKPAGFLRLMRLPLVPTAMADSLAGLLIQQPAPNLAVLAGVAGVSALAYALGMVLNDLADRERDRELHPERPLVRGTVSVREAWGLAATLLAGALCLAWLVGPAVLAVTAVLIAVILAYDGILKKWGMVGALAMGGARGLNVLVGMAAAGSMPAAGWDGYPLLLACYVGAVTGISLLEEAPNRFWFAAYSMTAVAACGLLACHSATRGSPGGVAVSGLAGLHLTVQAARVLRRFDRRRIEGMVLQGILMIILLDSTAVLAGPAPYGCGLALLALYLPASGGIYLSARKASSG